MLLIAMTMTTSIFCCCIVATQEAMTISFLMLQEAFVYQLRNGNKPTITR
jgi:hypothetical protein